MPGLSFSALIMPKKIKLWSPVILSMGIIFYTSSIPGKEIPSLFNNQDIVYHILVFLILAYFFARALKNTMAQLSIRKVIIFTLIFGIMYGISDEFHQSFVPNRSVSAYDVFIDGVGSFLGGLICRLQI